MEISNIISPDYLTFEYEGKKKVYFVSFTTSFLGKRLLPLVLVELVCLSVCLFVCLFVDNITHKKT